MTESLRQCEREAKGAILLQDVPLDKKLTYVTSSQPAEILCSRTFFGRIDRTWKVSSFSSLTASPEREPEPFYHNAGDLPDYDHVVVAEPLPEEEPTGIFAFPRGTKAGTFMHDLLEHLDFGENDASLVKSLVADKLRQ